MENKVPKYSIGDIIKLNEDNTLMKKIILICESFYDETGYSKEQYYYVKFINDDSYPPDCMKESSIDKYYTKL
jgi:hypothetical protein